MLIHIIHDQLCPIDPLSKHYQHLEALVHPPIFYNIIWRIKINEHFFNFEIAVRLSNLCEHEV